jgi:KipI family sensor histidine kinase inhibitor
VRAVGAVGALVEASNGHEAQALATWAASHPARDRLEEVIPGACTLYIAGPPDAVHRVARDAACVVLAKSEVATGSRLVTIDVRYDGLDLAEASSSLGLSPDELVKFHTGQEFVVQFFGFSPGQAFFAELPEQLRLPRRQSPRVRVPGGAVAIANEFTVIYPQDSPGGWNLIGTRVSEPLWDTAADPPNLVSIGDRIRFRAVS